MKINEMAIALDVDGVLLNFDRAFAEVGTDVLGRPLVAQSRAYALPERYALVDDEFDRVWGVMHEHAKGFPNLPIIEEAIEGFAALQRLGYRLHLVTGIEPHLAQKRLDNLSKYGLTPDTIDCVGFGNASKLNAIRERAPVAFVDDRLHLLHEVPFVPHRVWIDNNDDQGGLLPDAPIITARNLTEWVRDFAPHAWAEALTPLTPLTHASASPSRPHM